MSVLDGTSGTSRHSCDYSDLELADVDVTSGIPTDRVRWGPILAGTFAALTALAILATLGIAVGLSSYDQAQDSPRNFALGYGIWGILSTIAAFAFGGFMAARVAALRGRNSGLLNGMMVAAFGLPLLMFMVGSAGTLMGHAGGANGLNPQARGASDGRTSADSAMTASARVPADSSGTINAANPGTIDREDARHTASRAAWSTLVAMVVALGAASFGGYAGARETDNLRDGRARRAHA